MHRYPEHYIQAGERLTPIELNAELANLASEVNGRIDRENFNLGKAGIPETRVSNFAINRLLIAEATANQDVPLFDPVGKTEWVELTGSAVAFTSGDEMIVVEAGANWYHTVTAFPHWQRYRVVFGVKIDGNIYFGGADRAGAEYDFGHIDIAISITAGSHRVVPVIRVMDSGGDGFPAAAGGCNVRVDNSQCMVREAIR